MFASQNHHPKPYFLEGLLHAKGILQQLKKNKEEQIQFSPIRRKHTKFSNQTIIEDQEQPYYNSPHRQQGNSIKNNHQHQRSHSSNYNFSKNDYYRSSFGKESPGEELKRQIQGYRTQINEIGKELETVNNQIQSYEIVFEHLCECYRANSAIVNKNHKLKRQSLRLAEQKAQILSKLQGIQRQQENVDLMTKKANNLIQKHVQEYIRDILIYNKEEELGILPERKILDKKKVNSEESEEEQGLIKQLNLNFKQYKKDKDEYTQKKVLIQPKKLQNKVSFQEEIDVISKYYEAELSNI